MRCHARSRVWHRRVWRLAGPIIISNLTVPLVGATDTAVAGHLSDPVYVGAVGLGSVIFSVLFWSFGFLRMATTGFVAQAYGSRNWLEVRSTLARAVLLAVLLGMALIVLQRPLLGLAFLMVDGNSALRRLALSYCSIRIWGAPAVLINYTVLGALIGIHDTRRALLLQVLLNGCNIVLDVGFVQGLGWNVAGVAAASVLGQIVAALAGVAVLVRRLRPAAGMPWWADVIIPARMWPLFTVSGNIFLRTLCVSAAFYYFNARSAALGESVLAANTVLMNFQQFLSYGLDGFAHAAEALTGGAYGAGRAHTFRQAVRVSTLWALATAVAFSLFYALAGPYLIDLLTSIDSIRQLARVYLPWLVLSPLLSVWSFQLDGIFIGTTRSVEMRNSMVLALVAFVILVWWLVPLWGNHGLWLALLMFMLVRAVTLSAWYPRIGRTLAAR